MIERTLKPLANRSFFLFGPRQTGKSTFVQQMFAPEDLLINLLPQRTFLAYSKNPTVFRQEVLSHHQRYPRAKCIVDEIQKIPSLLDEVHDLIESHGIQFVLTGSSARKLKRGAANLLAGRANTYHLFGLTYEELGELFDLEKVLLHGTLPYLWAQALEPQEKEEFLRSYSDTYLREEIQAEGLVRQVAPFARFLDIAASNDGEVVNYSNIARECGVSIKTVQEYYQILEDTFIAHRLDPWSKSVRKRLIAHSRYYFFDTGVTNAICYNFSGLDPVVRGRRFEQFIILQLLAINSYYRLGYQLFFWRTNTGLEVDIILAKVGTPIIAIEIKSTSVIAGRDAQGLVAFKDEYPEARTLILCTGQRRRDYSKEVLR